MRSTEEGRHVRHGRVVRLEQCSPVLYYRNQAPFRPERFTLIISHAIIRLAARIPHKAVEWPASALAFLRITGEICGQMLRWARSVGVIDDTVGDQGHRVWQL
jgi:hypothetical protein